MNDTATAPKRATANPRPPAKAARPVTTIDQHLANIAMQLEMLRDADLPMDEIPCFGSRVVKVLADAINTYRARPALKEQTAYDALYDIEALLNAAHDVSDSEMWRGVLAGCIQSIDAAVDQASFIKNEFGAAAAAPEPTTEETELSDGGEIAQGMMRRCTYEIEALCTQIARTADAAHANGEFEDIGIAYELRAAAIRVHALNSLLMSYHGQGGTTLLEAAVRIDMTRHSLDAALEAQRGAA